MKKQLYCKFIFMNIFLTFVLTLNLKTQNNIDAHITKTNFETIQMDFNEYYDGLDDKKGSSYKPFKRWEWFWEQRLYPNYEIRNYRDILNEYESIKQEYKMESLQSKTSFWKELGPKIVPEDMLNSGSGIGRLNVIELHPTNRNIFWVGSSMGGAWQTTDRGKTWECADFTTFLSMGVTDIKYAKSNTDVIYISTGDADVSWHENASSIGVIKSIDGGKTWKTTSIISELSENKFNGALWVDPENENIVIVGTNTGIFKTIDGGDKWERKIGGAYFRDLIQHPYETNVLYSSTYNMTGGGAIYISKDAGETWTEQWSDPYAVRIKLAICPKERNSVWGLASTSEMIGGRKYGFLGLYKSEDSGETWTTLSQTPNILGWATNGSGGGGQGQYDLSLAINPLKPKEIIVGGVNIWHSTDGGINWGVSLTNWYKRNKFAYVHADQHFITYDIKTGDVFVANDGGLYRNDNFPDEDSWDDISNGISISQFYKISISNDTYPVLLGGAQDNGTQFYKKGQWSHINGGDGMDCEINPSNSNYLYVSSQFGNFKMSDDGLKSRKYMISQNTTNENGGWVTPLTIDKTSPSILFVGYRNVWRSIDYGINWEKYGTLPSAQSTVVNEIEVSIADHNVVYASSKTTLMRRINNEDWEIIGNFVGVITSIQSDKYDPLKVWVAISGYSKGKKIFLVDDIEIINKSEGLPNVPANDILILDDNETMFAATDIGIYMKEGNNTPWKYFSYGMPNLIIYDLEYHKKSGKLYAGTFGRGLWITSLDDCDMNEPDIEIDGDLEFCRGDSTLLSIKNSDDYESLVWSNGDTTDKITVKKTGNYYVSAKNGIKCESLSDIVTINVLDFNELSIRSNKNRFALCEENDTLRLLANIGYQNYIWSTGDTTKNIYITEHGFYWVEATAKNGCGGRSEEIEIVRSTYPVLPEIKEIGKQLKAIFDESVPKDEIDNYTYIWYVNNSEVDSAWTQTITPKLSGLYTVEVFNKAGCSVISEQVDVVVSVKEDKYFSGLLNVYPNPNNGFFEIEFLVPGTHSSDITILDIEGKIIKEYKNINFNQFLKYNIDISSNVVGTYFVRVVADEYVFIKQIVKE